MVCEKEVFKNDCKVLDLKYWKFKFPFPEKRKDVIGVGFCLLLVGRGQSFSFGHEKYEICNREPSENISK